jgi:hypothetical protein
MGSYENPVEKCDGMNMFPIGTHLISDIPSPYLSYGLYSSFSHSADIHWPSNMCEHWEDKMKDILSVF